MIPPRDPTRDGPDPSDLATTVEAAPWSGPFEGLYPHARGGLGEVYRATDPQLHRTVAIKCLQERHADDPDRRQRFLLEAEVTARLEHPGVVPVYGLHAAGGRPAYAMRFIEGETFAEAIAAYHDGPPDPIAFRRLLRAFHQVCQTVAYAHSRGVIHRDLKPANIMLGKFGETLVVDWGLAKVVGRPEEARAAAAGETLIPSGDSGPGDTLMGSAVGTPAYMSPEQAAGRWDVVAQASDVYGLGAVLYTVLTGKLPLEGSNWPEMQQKIQQGDIPRPRQVKADVPRALEAVCLKAMALAPRDRYPTAQALAADVEHWLADEPVAAYREPFAARARRWAKRHRTLVSAAAVLLVAAVVGLSIGAVLLRRAGVETEKQRQAADTARHKAEAINRFLVDDLLKQADPVNNTVGDKLTVRQLLDKAADRLDARSGLADQPEVEAEVRSVIGHAYEYLSVFEKAEPHYRRAWEIRARLRGPADPETLATRNRYLFTVATQGPRPGLEAQAKASLGECERVLGPDHPETGDAANILAELYVNMGRADDAVELVPPGEPDLQRGPRPRQREDPGDRQQPRRRARERRPPGRGGGRAPLGRRPPPERRPAVRGAGIEPRQPRRGHARRGPVRRRRGRPPRGHSPLQRPARPGARRDLLGPQPPLRRARGPGPLGRGRGGLPGRPRRPPQGREPEALPRADDRRPGPALRQAGALARLGPLPRRADAHRLARPAPHGRRPGAGPVLRPDRRPPTPPRPSPCSASAATSSRSAPGPATGSRPRSPPATATPSAGWASSTRRPPSSSPPPRPSPRPPACPRGAWPPPVVAWPTCMTPARSRRRPRSGGNRPVPGTRTQMGIP